MGYERNDRGNSRDPRAGGYDRDRNRYEDPNDRGFFERAGDEVRSWFGDEEAERRRRYDEARDERYDGGRDRSRYATYAPGGYRSPDRYPSWARSNRDEGRGFAGSSAPYSTHYAGPDEDRQFGTDYTSNRDYGSRGLSDAGYRYSNEDSFRDREDEYRAAYARQGQGRGNQKNDDPHGYRNWRDRQVESFDRDYDEYRREHQSRFEGEFAAWRQNRQTQRDSLRQAREHQEVLGSDGEHVGTVDHVRGDQILLTKTDKDAGGHHHSIPSSWISKVDDKVHLSKTADEAKKAWNEQNERGGLFDRDTGDQTRTDLNRSFSGTYDRK
jgi:hypothetical protein